MDLLNIRMTSNTTPAPFVVSSSHANGWRVFDGTTSTYINSTTEPAPWVILYLGELYDINRWGCFCAGRSGSTYYSVNAYLDVSTDGTNWTNVGTVVSNRTWAYANIDIVSCSWIRVRVPSGASGRYLWEVQLYGLPRNVIPMPEDIIGNFETYYVSQQNGNDNNDGVTPETPWSTLDKAMQNAKANTTTDTQIFIGPGTYSLDDSTSNIAYPGLDSQHRIIYAGDQDCLHLVNDSPGNVVITRSDAQRFRAIFDMYNRPFVELRNVDIACSNFTSVAIYGENVGNQIARDVKIFASHPETIGCYNIDAYNTTAMCNYMGFGKVNAFNCIAIGSTNSGYYSCKSYNSLAFMCSLGYSNSEVYNSEAWLCSSVANGGSAANCLASQCYVTSLPTGWTGTMCGQTSASIINTSPIAIQKLNLTNTLRTGLADWGYDLSAIAEAMTDIDGIARNSSTADIGPWELADHSLEHDDFYLNKPALKINGHNQIIFDLPVKEGQEITKSVYVKWFEPDTQNIKLNASMTSNAEPAGYTVDSSTNVVGYEPWRVFDSSGTTTYWSASGELPQWISYEFPSDAIVNKYVLSIPTNAQNFSPKDFVLEAWDGSQWVTLDTQSNVVWTSGQTKTFTFSNETVYRKYRLVISSVQSGSVLNIYNFEIWGTLIREQIDNDLKPQLKVEGFGVDQIDSCTADRDIWQKLSVTFTPSKSGVMVVRLISRNPVSGSYAIFSDPQ